METPCLFISFLLSPDFSRCFTVLIKTTESGEWWLTAKFLVVATRLGRTRQSSVSFILKGNWNEHLTSGLEVRQFPCLRVTPRFFNPNCFNTLPSRRYLAGNNHKPCLFIQPDPRLFQFRHLSWFLIES